jgi:hypothetical protein
VNEQKGKESIMALAIALTLANPDAPGNSKEMVGVRRRFYQIQ